MNNILIMPQRKHLSDSDIEAEARAWVIALDSEAPSEGRLNEFRAWLQQSPSHKETFKNTACIWSDLDLWSEFLYPQEESVHKSVVSSTTSAINRLLRPAFALASLTACTIVIGLVFYLLDAGLFQEHEFAAEYKSPIGEIKSVALPDGSDVDLNTRSKIAVSYAHSARIVNLMEGEVFFEVAHDPDKPFVVYAGKYAVKAVGTAFSVQLLADGVELNVTDGRVEVAALSSKSTTSDLGTMDKAISVMHFIKGQRAILKGEHAEIELVQKVDDKNMKAALSWRNGLLIFDNDPLHEVVKELNRYTPTHVVITDAGIRDIRIGGYFRIDDVTAILHAMETGFGIHVEQIDDRLIYLMGQRDQQSGSQ